MRTAAVCLILGIAATAVSHPVEAQEEVTVLGITSVEGNDVLARVSTRHLRVAVNRVRGWGMNPETPDLSTMVLLSECDEAYPYRGCMPAIAEMRHARHVVSGILSLNPDAPGDYLLDLFWYDVEAAGIVGVYRAEIPSDADDAFFNGRMRGWLTEMGVPASAAAGSDRDAFVGSGIGLLSAAAVSFGVTIASWVRISDIQNDDGFHAYREMWPTTANVCTEAVSDPTADRIRSLCGDDSLFEGLQVGFLLAAVVSAAVGGTFLGLGASQPNLTVTPSVSLDRAAFAVTARF